jgi:hypothetical protein
MRQRGARRSVTWGDGVRPRGEDRWNVSVWGYVRLMVNLGLVQTSEASSSYIPTLVLQVTLPRSSPPVSYTYQRHTSTAIAESAPPQRALLPHEGITVDELAQGSSRLHIAINQEGRRHCWQGRERGVPVLTT